MGRNPFGFLKNQMDEGSSGMTTRKAKRQIGMTPTEIWILRHLLLKTMTIRMMTENQY